MSTLRTHVDTQDSIIINNLETEESKRISADDNLQDNIDALRVYVETQDSNIINDLEIEKNTRISVDEDLTLAINNLKTGTGLNDGVYISDNNANYINSAASLFNADILLDSIIMKEKSDRIAAIALLQVKPSEGAFADGDKTKLDGIEAGADVTDTANVTAAGALMDSEVTDLAGIKSVTISTLQAKPSEGAFADGDKTN